MRIGIALESDRWEYQTIEDPTLTVADCWASTGTISFDQHSPDQIQCAGTSLC